jgi:hypothetical protein
MPTPVFTNVNEFIYSTIGDIIQTIPNSKFNYINDFIDYSELPKGSIPRGFTFIEDRIESESLQTKGYVSGVAKCKFAFAVTTPKGKLRSALDYTSDLISLKLIEVSDNRNAFKTTIINADIQKSYELRINNLRLTNFYFDANVKANTGLCVIDFEVDYNKASLTYIA